MDELILCDDKSERVWVIVSATIKEGCLEVFGHDLGDAPSEYFGRCEFEYWYKFNKINTEKLIECLTRDNDDLRKALLDNFSGLAGCKNLIKYCEENDIEYQYMSWW